MYYSIFFRLVGTNMAKKPAKPKSPTLTLQLPGQRQASGVALRDIVESTKISLRFLEAIEFEEFERLPGGIFSTSYIKQYAAAIGIDPEPLLSLYRLKTGLETSSTSNERSRPDGAGRLGLFPTT